jgi:hypothetical protein
MTMAADEGLTRAELDAQDGAELPDREAMSTLDPTAGSTRPRCSARDCSTST